ncbi:hypothetical protein JQS43_09255 [Natronosporangium hydrolyticum]|uniref:PIN domain-containing protein n=1 Tax=Natronosporangium hydrolyticum TaxID=2811111 RepID=A0A895YK81_9ACTN|nr:hypothetical protein [Natronosporangium hydrolyticum]QSB16442.1 hypothetical protein JQS43_09255 [Natronosporangium hydrolyticum]
MIADAGGWVLDTGALLAYANDDLYLQSVVRSCRRRGRTLLVSTLSLREALASRPGSEQLTELLHDAGTVLAEPGAHDVAVLCAQVKLAGGEVTAAHVAQLAAARRWPVLSDRPHQLAAAARDLLIEPV